MGNHRRPCLKWHSPNGKLNDFYSFTLYLFTFYVRYCSCSFRPTIDKSQKFFHAGTGGNTWMLSAEPISKKWEITRTHKDTACSMNLKWWEWTILGCFWETASDLITLITFLFKQSEELKVPNTRKRKGLSFCIFSNVRTFEFSLLQLKSLRLSVRCPSMLQLGSWT